jgi:cytochrome b561
MSHAGRPYSLLLFNIHKLLGFGLFVLLTINVYWLHQATPLSVPQRTACLIAGLFFLATILTGGLVSISKTMPVVVSLSHKLLPYLTVLSTVVSLYLLLRDRYPVE